MSDGLIDPKGAYSIFRNDRRGRDGGGVCILVGKRIGCTIIQEDVFTASSFELVGCKLFTGGQFYLKNDIIIICVYLPPDISIDAFNDAMHAIRMIWPSDSVGIVVGDFNLPDIDWSTGNPKLVSAKSTLMDMFTDLSCSQFIRTPTRGSNVLDLLFCNNPMLIFDVSVGVPFSTSDHAMIFFVIYSYFFKCI